MKRVTVSQARKIWFRLLDEVIDGETVVMERHGARIMLKRDHRMQSEPDKPALDYSSCLRVHNVEQADNWHWDWTPEKIVALIEDEPTR
jgi:hypothetical protein